MIKYEVTVGKHSALKDQDTIQHFNSKSKSIGLFDNDKNEEKILISNVNEIYKYSDQIRSVVFTYDSVTSE